MNEKNLPLKEIILSLIGVLGTIICIVLELIVSASNPEAGAFSFLTIIILSMFVLLLAAYSARKDKLIKVASIIIKALSLATIGILTIVEFVILEESLSDGIINWERIGFFTITIISLVVCVLNFIYYLSAKNELISQLNKLTKTLFIISISMLLLWVIIVMIVGTSYSSYNLIKPIFIPVLLGLFILIQFLTVKTK